MSCGGTIVDVEVEADRLFVHVENFDRGERQVRGVPKDRVTRCIGTGDVLWWQGRWTMWTPQGSQRTNCGRDYDIQVGFEKPRGSK